MRKNIKKKCLVIGHRGASGIEPENTLRAFEKAHKIGADGIELDIFLTRDQRVVVTHDDNTYRVTKHNREVTRSTFRELQELDFGKKEKIPLLSEVFDHFLKKFSVINVEIKSTGYKNNGVEEKLMKLIKKFKCSQKILVSSFNPLNLYRFKKIMPKVRIGYLVTHEQNIIARNRLMIRLLQPDILNLDHELKDGKGHQVFFKMPQPKWLWTVNTLQNMRYWLKQNVEAIMTNYPDKLVKEIKSAKDSN